MSRMTEWEKMLFHEEGVLNARTVRSRVVHIAADDGQKWGLETLCGVKMKGDWRRKFLLQECGDFSMRRCKKCEQRYLNRIK